MKQFQKYIHSKTIVVKAEVELEIQANTIFSILDNFDSEKIIDNASFAIGWSVYTLKEMNNQLIVHSPDYASDPFNNLTDDLTLALWVQLEQSHLLRKTGVEGKAIRFDDKVVYTRGVFDLQQTYLQRSPTTTAGDSGWFIGSKDGDNFDLKACYAFQLLKLNKKYIQYLVLPNNYLVVMEGENIKAILDENDENVIVQK